MNLPPDRRPPTLPLSMLTAEQLQDAAAFYTEFAADITAEDIAAMRSLAGDQAADDLARSRAACRQEAAVCELLAGMASPVS